MMILIPLTLLHFTAFNVFFGAIPGIRVKVIPLLANYVSFVETRFHDDSPWAPSVRCTTRNTGSWR